MGQSSLFFYFIKKKNWQGRLEGQGHRHFVNVLCQAGKGSNNFVTFDFFFPLVRSKQTNKQKIIAHFVLYLF